MCMSLCAFVCEFLLRLEELELLELKLQVVVVSRCGCHRN